MKVVIDIPDEDYKFISDLRFFNSGRRSYMLMERNVINAIKKSTPYEERPQGEWNYEKVAFYGVCSNCGVAVTSNKAEMFLYEEIREFPHAINFCPNCGADMRGKENESNDNL